MPQQRTTEAIRLGSPDERLVTRKQRMALETLEDAYPEWMTAPAIDQVCQCRRGWSRPALQSLAKRALVEVRAVRGLFINRYEYRARLARREE